MGSFAEIDLEIHEENISKDGFDDSAFSEDGVDTADTVGASPQKSPVETAPAQAAPVPSPTDTSESTEEEKRRAHEESEAKRKAEFEASRVIGPNGGGKGPARDGMGNIRLEGSFRYIYDPRVGIADKMYRAS